MGLRRVDTNPPCSYPAGYSYNLDTKDLNSWYQSCLILSAQRGIYYLFFGPFLYCI